MSKLFYPKEIIGSKFENNKSYFLVQWKTFSEPTWEPEDNISHRTDLINKYRDMCIIENLGLRKGGYIYCRVSSKEQSKYNKGHTSLEVQEEYIRKYCIENDINVINVVKEVYSAKNMDKMKGLKYLCDISTPGITIYIYDISRFSRNIHQALNILEELNNRNVSVHSVSENINYGSVSGRNQFRLQLCASNYYSEMCSKKVKESIEYRRSRGDFIGNTPFGYKTEIDEKTFIRSKIPCEEEMKIVNRICIKNKSIKDILNDLLKDRIKLRNKNPTLNSIKRIKRRFDIIKKPTFIYGKRKYSRK